MKKPRARRLKIEKYRMLGEQQWPAQRAGDLTASVIGALFGLHPRETAGGLFAKLTGVKGLDREDNAVMEHGRDLEPLVGKYFLRDHPGFRVTKARFYVRAPLLNLGATPDFVVTDELGRRGVMEAKTTTPKGYDEEWTDETPPTWIALQCLVQMMLTRAEIGWVSVLIDDGWKFKRRHYPIPRHEGAERRIQDAVAPFWSDIAAGREPKDDYVRDASLLPVLYPHHVAGKVVDWRGDNEVPGKLDELEQLKAEIAEKTTRKEEIEGELRFKMKDAEAAVVNGWRITNREQHRKEHTVKASDFRVLRIAREKAKQAA